MTNGDGQLAGLFRKLSDREELLRQASILLRDLGRPAVPTQEDEQKAKALREEIDKALGRATPPSGGERASTVVGLRHLRMRAAGRGGWNW